MSRNAGTTPSPAETTIRTGLPEPQLVRREEPDDPLQVRAAHLRVGRALGGASEEWKNMPIDDQGTPPDTIEVAWLDADRRWAGTVRCGAN